MQQPPQQTAAAILAERYRNQLYPYFNLPAKEAARKLGISPCELRRRSRVAGVLKWPYKMASVKHNNHHFRFDFEIPRESKVAKELEQCMIREPIYQQQAAPNRIQPPMQQQQVVQQELVSEVYSSTILTRPNNVFITNSVRPVPQEPVLPSFASLVASLNVSSY